MKLHHTIPYFLSLCNIGSLMVFEKYSLAIYAKCTKERDPQVCLLGAGIQCKYKSPCLSKTAGYDVKADCEHKEVVDKCNLPKKRKCGKKRSRRYVMP